MTLADLYTQLEIIGVFAGVLFGIVVFIYQTRTSNKANFDAVASQTKAALDKADVDKDTALDKANATRDAAFKEVNDRVEKEFKDAGLERQEIRTRLTILETIINGLSVKSSVEWESYSKNFPLLLKHAHTPVKDALIEKFRDDTITIEDIDQLDEVCMAELMAEGLSMSDGEVVVKMLVMLAVRKAELQGRLTPSGIPR